MKRLLAVLLGSFLSITQAAAVIVLITAIPTATGIVSSKFRDGNDGGAAPPSAPEMSQPAVINSTSASIPLLTACTGGTAPLAYEIEKSSTSSVAGWAVHATSIIFTDGIYVMTALTASTQYWTRLACVDNASRRSAYSSVFTFTTPAAGGGGDVTAPTAPTNVSAISTVAGQAVSTWTNGTDAVGIVTTNIIRGTVTDGLTCTVFAAGTVIDSVAYPATSYTDLSAPSGTTVYYRQEHLDAAGNVSTKSTRLCVTIASAGAGAIKWHPGHYVKTQGQASDGQSYWDEVFNSYLPKALESSNLKGALVEITWGDFNTTGSTYDWTRADAVLAWAEANNKRIIFKLSYKHFDGALGILGPTDLETTDAVQTTTGYLMAVWRQSVMDRFIAALQAFGARYDSNPRVEFITGSESSTGTWSAGTPSDYTKAAHSAQLQRLYPAIALAFPTTNTSASLNSIAGQLAILLEAAYVAKSGLNTPDAHDSCVAQMFRGTTIVCAGKTEDPVQANYRDLMAYHTIASQPTLGGKDDNGPPANIIDWAQINEVTHLSWVTTVSVSPNTWTEVKAAIAADPLTNLTCPAVYTSCNTN